MFKEINKEQEEYLLSKGFKKEFYPESIQYVLKFQHGLNIYIKTDYPEFRISIIGTYRGISIEKGNLLVCELQEGLKLIDILNQDMTNLI